MKNFKKVICFVLSLIFCLTLTSCKDKTPSGYEKNPTFLSTEIPIQAGESNINTSTPSLESSLEPTLTPVPEPTIPIEFSPEIEIFFDEEPVPMDEITFGENPQELFDKNFLILQNSFTEYTNVRDSNIDIKMKALKNDSSLINETIYFVQSPAFISFSFTAQVDKETEEKDIEVYCDGIRDFTGLFVPDIDLFDIISETFNNFGIIKKDKNNVFEKIIWFTDNTEFMSIRLTGYEDEEQNPRIDIDVTISVHNEDILYKNNERIDFQLLDLKRNDENANIGTIIGATNAGKEIFASSYKENIDWENTVSYNPTPIIDNPESTASPTETDIPTIDKIIAIKVKEPYVIPTLEIEGGGNAFDLKELKSKFNLKNFELSENKQYVIASNEEKTLNCEIPTESGVYKISSTENISEIVEFLTGYQIQDINDVEPGKYPIICQDKDTGNVLEISEKEYRFN